MASSGHEFDITGGFVLDTEGLSRGVAKVTGQFNTLGTRIAHSFRERIVSTIGAAGVTWAIKKELEKAHKVSVDAAKFGLDVQTFQTLQRLAEDTGNSVEDLANQFILAKTTGTQFAKEVAASMEELKASGLIMSAEDVESMTRAYQSLLNLAAKLSPIVGALSKATADTINDIGANKQGVGSGLWQTIKDSFKIVAGRGMELVGGLADPNNPEGQKLSEMGRNLRRSVTANTNAEDIESGGTQTETALEKLIRELQQQAATNAWWHTVGGDENWSSTKAKKVAEKSRTFEVSSLTGIGGYMQTAAPRTVAETQLEMINRKMDDLVASGRKMAL
jgi:hypothetical protein